MPTLPCFLRARVGGTVPAMPSRHEVLHHLERLLLSPEFASSNRCKEFLRYVATEALAGRSAEIKERTIATDVFGKDDRYNPNEESLVRVKATEVRRRLAKYYSASGSDSSLRIDLPVGSYVPKFERVAAAPPVKLPSRSGELFWYLAGGLAAVILLAGAAVWWHSAHLSPLERFWRPVTAQREPMLIFLPILSSRGHPGEHSDRVGVGAASAAVRLADRFSRLGNPYTLRVGDDLVFSDLRRQPAILLGNFLSYWTKDLNRDLRFVFDQTADRTRVLDTKTGQMWKAEGETPDGYATLDYALVTRVFESRTGQILIIASGITTFGTQAATDFLLDPKLFSQLSKSMPPDWAARNFQVLLSARVIGATPGPPQVVTAYFW